MEVENLSCLLKFPSLLTPSDSPCRGRTITKLNFMWYQSSPYRGSQRGSGVIAGLTSPEVNCCYFLNL